MKIWPMMQKRMFTLVMQHKEAVTGLREKSRKARVAMNQKLPSMNVKIAKTVLTKKNVHVRKETSGLYVSKSFLEKRQESYENILTETGIQCPVFYRFKVVWGFGV